MSTRLTIDGAGRVVLPKPVRDKLDLGPGDCLELENTGETITLRPLRTVAPLNKEQGVWVFRTGQPLAATVTEAVLQQVRNDRDKHNFDPKA